MSRWITRVFSILCILATIGALSSWGYASFAASREWVSFGLVLGAVAIITGVTWGMRSEHYDKRAWER